MGNQTTVVIRNDCLSELRHNAQAFVDSLCLLASTARTGEVPRFTGAAKVIANEPVHYVDILAVGDGTGKRLCGLLGVNISPHDAETPEKALRELAERLGFKVTKTRTKQAKKRRTKAR